MIKVKKITIIIMFLVILSKIVGFGRELLLTYHYGASYISDVYVVSLTIPAVLFSFIAISITTTFIPIYSDIKNNKGNVEANRFSSNLLNWIFIACFIIIIIVFVFTEELLNIFASGFTTESKEIAILFTRITIFSIIFTGFIALSTGYLNANKSFVAPAVIGIPLSIIVVISVILSIPFGIIMLPIGILVAGFSQSVILLWFNVKNGFLPRLNIKLDENIKKIFILIIPLIFSTAIHEVNVIVDRNIASNLLEGGVSALYYANRINLFVKDIVIMSLLTVSFPLFSKYYSENNFSKFKSTFNSDLSSILFLTIPIVGGGVIFSKEIITLLYGRGAFDEFAISITSQALLYYLIGIIGVGIYLLCAKSFYALHITKIPVIISAVGMALNIVLNLILSKFMGISGLALSTSISAFLTALLGIIFIRRRLGPVGIKVFRLSKILLATIIMIVISKLFNNMLLNYASMNISLIFSVFLAVIVYIVLCYFLKVDELIYVIDRIKSLVNKRKINS